jgi:hypothetical protein
MKKIIEEDISKQAKEHAEKYELYHNYLHISHLRNRTRIQSVPYKDVRTPEEWKIDKKFNPFYVLKRSKQIASSISKKILNGTYKPNPPYVKYIDKKGGGKREISVYQIPDSAVSDKFYNDLLAKNKHRFSSLAYAYRNDRNIHFAIQDIANELNATPRIYVAEFDFSNFFGSINHEYLFQQLEENAFLVSDTDNQIIRAFLNGNEGIPLGTSISLFLANVVCWKLDRGLENEGIRFARYADDTIIWSRDYAKITKAFDIINAFSKETKININYNKSEGISLLQADTEKSEFNNTKEFIEFLGYRISNIDIGMKDDSVKKIKAQISYLLFRNLIQPVKSTPFNGVNIPANGMDKDFLTAIMQIRRYLYGNLTEESLKKYLNGTYKKLSFKGIMSFYPLISDETQMKNLDAWLVSTVLNSLQLRLKYLRKHNPNFNSNQFPFNISGNEFVKKCKIINANGKVGLLQIPSFLRIYKAMQIGLVNEGIEKVMHPKSGYYV